MILSKKTGASSNGSAFSSIQGRLVSLLLIVLVPILIAQAYFRYDRYQSRRRIECVANLELARATAKAFDTFVQDVLHQELAIGLAFTSSQTLSGKEKSQMLFENRAVNPTIWHFFWVNPAGIVMAATGSQFIGMNLTDRESYGEIVAGKDWVVSDLILSRTTRQPSFTISRGIRNERGELLGIIVAGILPGKLDRVLAVERPGDAGVSLLDSKGMHVYRYPATEYTWEQRNWLKLYPFLEEVIKGKEVVITGHVSKIQHGIKRIVAFTPVPGIGWTAACSRAEEEAVGPIISATLQEAGLILLVALVSLLTAFALSRTISSSVIDLRNHARSLGQGKTENPLTISGPAEIKDLAEAFNKMAEDVRFRETALRENQRRLSMAVSATADAIWEWNLQTNKAYYSPRWYEMLGYEANEISMDLDGWKSLCHPDDLQPTLDLIQSKLKSAPDAGYATEFRMRSKDGAWVWILGRGRVVGRDAAGNAVLLSGTNTDITDQKRAQEALKASLAEKEVLLKEIHHRVKNNMQVISSLVDLQAEEIKDAAMRDIFQDMIFRVRSMAMVHEKLYQSADLAHVDFADYAQSLLGYLWRAQGAANGIQLDLQLESVLLPVNAAVPCGLILNELFSNALKHAFIGRASGNVTVSLNHTPKGQVRLGVRDDGTGMPPEVDWKKIPSLGLRLVQMLARQLNAVVTVTSDRGTEFMIRFEVTR